MKEAPVISRGLVVLVIFNSPESLVNPPRDSTPNPARDASLDPYLGFHPNPSSPEGRESRRPPFLHREDFP